MPPVLTQGADGANRGGREAPAMHERLHGVTDGCGPEVVVL